MTKKEQFLELIRTNIEKYEFHITTVNSSIEPRYAYTIGLTKLFGFELIFAGGIIFLMDDLTLIFHAIVDELKKGNGKVIDKFKVGDLGEFALAATDATWNKLMLLGVYDYYKTTEIVTFQIIPDSSHYTLDIPKMSEQWNPVNQPVWRWLTDKWILDVPEDSQVVTNIKALLGEPITELTRWEDNYWEMFAGAGPDVAKEDCRVVSLATMLGIDKTFTPALNLALGKGIWRDSAASSWNNW